MATHDQVVRYYEEEKRYERIVALLEEILRAIREQQKADFYNERDR